MSMHKLVMLAIAALLGPLIVGVGSASAHTTTITIHGGGSFPPEGLTVTGSGEPVTIKLPIGHITCDVTFHGDLFDHDGTTVDGGIDSFTLEDCTDSVPVVNFDHCTESGPSDPTLTVRASGGSGGTVTTSNLYERCHVAGSGFPGSACYYYSAGADGVFANTNSTLSYTNAPLIRTVPPGGTGDLGNGICGSGAGTLSGDIKDVHTEDGKTITIITS